MSHPETCPQGTDRRNRGQGGFALIFALILLILGLAVGAVIAANLTRASLNLRRQAEAVHLQALLDAGMARTLAELERDSSWSGGSESFETGSVQVSAGLDLNPDYRRVEIEAVYRQIARRAAARVLIPGNADDVPLVTAWAPYAEAFPGDPLPPIEDTGSETGTTVSNPFVRR